MAQWCMLHDDSLPVAQKHFDYRPAGEVLASWVENYRNLNWVPNRFAIMPGIFTELTQPHYEGPHPINSGRNNTNFFRAQQRIYKRYVWPGDAYREEACQQELQAFEGRLGELYVPL